MQEGYRPDSGSGLGILGKVLLVLFGGFLLQVFFEVGLGQNGLLRTGSDRGFVPEYLALSIPNLTEGQIWTLFSYGLLHFGPIHLLLNGFGTFILWRALREDFSDLTILQLYLAGIFVGGLSWSGLHFYMGGGMIVGASAGVMSLLAVVCLTRWEQMAFLLFPPIPIRLKYLFFGVLGIDVFGLLIYEIKGGGVMAHSAHLGGFAIGVLFFRTYWSSSRRFAGTSWLATEGLMGRFAKRPAKTSTIRRTAYKVNLREEKPASDLKVEVDRILDKINEEGFGALTPEERGVLEKAGDLLNR